MNVTLLPVFTVRVAGENAKFLIVTVWPPAAGGVDVGDEPEDAQAARAPKSAKATANMRSRDMRRSLPRRSEGTNIPRIVWLAEDRRLGRRAANRGVEVPQERQ